jgi:hypothetical protein
LAKTGAFAHEKKRKKKKRTQLKLKKRGRKCSSVLALPSFLGCHGKREAIRCKANKHSREKRPPQLTVNFFFPTVIFRQE